MSNLIKKIQQKSFTVSVLAVSVFLPNLVNAQNSSASQSVTLENPLRVGTIEELLVAILNIVIVIAVPFIVFFIIYAGFMYVTAKGNPAKVEQAHNALLYALIGGVLIIGAVAIAQIVGNLVNSFR